jgi:hypothetical protein
MGLRRQGTGQHVHATVGNSLQRCDGGGNV